MATSKIKCCGPCLKKEHLEIPGIVWCRDCDDFLCKECNTLHSKFSATSHHIVISLENYLKFPQFTIPLINQCQQHEKKYEYYCTFHGINCCVECIPSNHKQCTNLKPLDDVIKTIKSSAAVTNLERDVKDLSEIFTVAEKSIDGNIISLASEEQMFLDEVRHVRKAINKELDKMERSLTNEFYTQYQNEHENLSNQLKFIKSKKNVISQFQNEIDIMKMVATDLQVFTSIQKLEQNVHREITQFMEWKDENNPREVHLKFNKSEMYSRLPDAKDFFGFITVDEKPAGIQLPSVIKNAVAPAPVTSPLPLVVGVDIGSYICCAFSTRDDYKKDNLSIRDFKWRSPEYYCSQPSCLLLDRNRNLISFGYEAKEQFANAVLDHSEEQYSYFENVLREISESQTVIRDHRNTEVLASDVFGQFIKGFTKWCLADFKRILWEEFPTDFILWVFAFPRQLLKNTTFLEKSLEQTNIPKRQQKLVNRHEAILRYCERLPIDKLEGVETKSQVFKPGMKHMIVHIGEENTDISVFEKTSIGKWIELNYISIGKFGVSSFQHTFMEFFSKLVGKEVFSSLQAVDITDLQHSIMSKFRNFHSAVGKKINITIPFVQLEDMCQKYHGKSLQDVISSSVYSSQMCLLFNGKLRIDFELVKNIFMEAMDMLIDQIENTMKKPESSGISAVLVVVDSDASAFFQEAFKARFDFMNVIVPHRCAELAPVKGAVIFGHLSSSL